MPNIDPSVLPTNTANGLALLDSSGLLPSSIVPFLKNPVRVASTAAMAASTYSSGAKTLTANANGALASIDGVSVSVGERILLKDQATGSQNGVYVVTSLGGAGSVWILTRATDMAASSDLVSGTVISVTSGTTNGATQWTLTSTGTLTLDTTSLTFAKPAVPITIQSGGTKVQSGTVLAGSNNGSFSVTFSPAFSSTPVIVLGTDHSPLNNSSSFECATLNASSSTGFTGFSFSQNGATTTASSNGLRISWIAIGT